MRALRVVFLVPLAAACHHAAPASHAPQPTPAAAEKADPVALGHTAGTQSPRPADCSAHCEHALKEETSRGGVGAAQAERFRFGCVSSCIEQIGEQLGLQCYEAFGASSAEEWQELYLARGMVEHAAYCIRASDDRSPTASAVLDAVATEQRTPASREAVAKERKALLSGSSDALVEAQQARRAANGTPEWQRAVDAFRAWSVDEATRAELQACFESVHQRACGFAPE